MENLPIFKKLKFIDVEKMNIFKRCHDKLLIKIFMERFRYKFNKSILEIIKMTLIKC